MRWLTTALLSLAMLAVPLAALAQQDEVVEGARDFRTAPILSDGAYTDTILVGETLWYGVHLINDDEKEFDVFAESLLSGRDDVSIHVEWIGPTLGTVTSGDEIEAAQFYYGGSNDGETWLWFLKFTVQSDSGALEEVPFRFTVSGAETFDSGPCSVDDGCAMAVEASELETEISELQAIISGNSSETDESTVSEPGPGPQTEVVDLQNEIAALENELAAAQSRVTGLETEIAAMEAAEPVSNDAGGGGPLAPLLLVVGILAAGVGAFLLSRSRGESRG